MIYTVTFNPAIDYVVGIDGIETGCVNRLSSEQIYFGGKGINISIVLRELGIESTALGFVAGFTGEAIENGLKEAGIITDFVRLEKGNSRINVKIKSDAETELNASGPEISDTALSVLFEKLKSLRNGDTIVLAGSVPKSLPEDIYEQILHQLSDRDIRAVVDASKELLIKSLRYKPFLIKPNLQELGEIFGEISGSDDEIIACAEKLREMGAQNVLVSMAGDGAILLDSGNNIHKSGVCSGTVRNSVGAGDSMIAGFLAGISAGDFTYALKLGTAAGGATAFSDGLAAKADILRLFEQL
ncbi:MAG: 1-phosphofructokinase [Ruminococcus sp.]|nr:1-phosphofructokinase [Ruminococcus sp.]